MKSVVVTGVSTGIGWGVVQFLIGNGIHVFGSVRKQTDADRLLLEFPNHFTPLLFDVTDQESVRREAERVRVALAGQTLFGLVNNAGIAIPGPLCHQSLADFRQHIDVNLVGAFVTSQAFVPHLGADKGLAGEPGRIVNITSLGGKIGSPFLGGYCSAKHGLEGLSEVLRRELMIYGIDVIIVGPGAVKTPIWQKAETADFSEASNGDYVLAMRKFSEFLKGASADGLSVERVGEIVFNALTVANPKVRYALAPNLFFDWIVPRSLPRRVVDRFFARRLGLVRITR